MRKLTRFLVCCVALSVVVGGVHWLNAGTPDAALCAGIRGSNIWHYSPQYWAWVADSMSRGFAGPASRAAVWIVSFYGDGGDIYVQFPSEGRSFPHMIFKAEDRNESYLSFFDEQHMRVWLQVEPGAASVPDLIDLVLARYRHHKCVVGFGIDVEWLDAQVYTGGRQVTNAEALAWENQIRAYDTTYTLFLKHYSPGRMPPTYRGNILFIDDSQQFSSGLSSCIREFSTWAGRFAPAAVGFQYGYAADRWWWGALQNPPAAIGNALLANLQNVRTLFWVDFTVTEVFPPAAMAAVSNPEPHPDGWVLLQNFPNPFNPATRIRFDLGVRSRVTLTVLNVLGEVVRTLLQEEKLPGSHTVVWDGLTNDGVNVSGGVYFCKMSGISDDGRSFAEVKKMMYVK